MTTESGRCLTCGHDSWAHRAYRSTACWFSGCICAKFEPVNPKVEGTPDLHQAIQAATVALAGRLFGTPEQLERYANIAVTAAAPVLLQATRDRHDTLDEAAICQHELEHAREDVRRLQDENERVRHELDECVALRELLRKGQAQVDQLRDLLEQSISRPDYDSDGHCNYCRMDIQRISRHAHCWQCGLTGGQHLDDCRVGAALQTSRPTTDHTIHQQIQQRLREVVKVASLHVIGANDHGTLNRALEALDQAAQGEVDR